MNLLNVSKTFPNEASCKRKWTASRDHHGAICSHCGSNAHYWKSDKECYECKICKYGQSLKSNIIRLGSRLPFRYWFIAFHLLTSTKKSFSAKELQRQLGHKYYEPIWTLLHKLRDAEYRLEGVIEFDEGFFSTELQADEKNKPLKRGRGSQKKSKVLVMSESVPVQKNENKKECKKSSNKDKIRKVNHIKIFVINDLKSETINSKVQKHIDKQAEIDSDNSTSYTNLGSPVAQHRPKVIPNELIEKALLWVHIAISNAKRMLLDIFHDIKPEYLQNYLNGFCYKFNRKYFGEVQFERLLVISVAYKNQFRYHVL